MVHVSVPDAGPGVRTEKIDQLFQSFITTKRHGMGLGLSISRTMVEVHGGRSGPSPTGMAAPASISPYAA